MSPMTTGMELKPEVRYQQNGMMDFDPDLLVYQWVCGI